MPVSDGGFLVLKIIVQLMCGVMVGVTPAALHAQVSNGQPMDMPMDMAMETPGWHFMQDAIVFGLFNHQGGPRGGDEVKVPNWWMGMFDRKVGKTSLTFNTMLS